MTARGRGCAVLCLALSLSFAWGPRPLEAQGGGGGAGGSLSLTPVQALSYGILTPGSPDAVAVGDVVRRGEMELKAKGQVDIMMVLPTAMTNPAGAQIPLQFRFGDAGLQLKGSAGVVLFDPNVGYSTSLAPSQSPARIFMGGVATPAASQPAGDYTAQITVIVAQP